MVFWPKFSSILAYCQDKSQILEPNLSPNSLQTSFLFPEAQYSSLCALCQEPGKCDYPDDYSGYEGAIRCLAHNGGQVAFTKVIYVRKFFGVSLLFNVVRLKSLLEGKKKFHCVCCLGLTALNELGIRQRLSTVQSRIFTSTHVVTYIVAVMPA